MWCSSQGSVLEPLLFLLYVNDMPIAVSRCDLFAGDSCLVFQHKNVEEIEKVFTSKVKKRNDKNLLPALQELAYGGQKINKSINFSLRTQISVRL